MKEFALIFRQPGSNYTNATPEQIEAVQEKWHEWIEGLKSQDKLVTNGLRLELEGKVLKAGGIVTDGPFVEIREMLGGVMIVKAENLEEATTLAHGCPALMADGSVEIRGIFQS